MEKNKVDSNDVEELWVFLLDNKIIKNEEMQKKFPPDLHFPVRLQCYEIEIRDMIDATYKDIIYKTVLELPQQKAQ